MITLKLLQHNIRCLATKLKNYVKLNDSGQIPTEYLPSYVDDVLEVASLAQAPTTGEKGKIYVTLDTNKTYRWSGTSYIEVPSGTTNWGTVEGDIDNQADLKAKFDGIDYQKVLDNSGVTLGNSTVLTKSSAGTFGACGYNYNANAFTLAYRDTNGNIKVGTAVSDNDAVNLQTLNTSLGTQDLDTIATNSGAPLVNYTLLVRGGGVAQRLSWASPPTPSSLAQRTSTGSLKIADPTVDNEAATKSYVDTATKFANIITNSSINLANQTVLVKQSTGIVSGVKYDTGATAYSIAMRGSTGGLTVSEPVVASDAATKNYVDGVVKLDTIAQDGKNTTNGKLRFTNDAYPARTSIVDQRGFSFTLDTEGAMTVYAAQLLNAAEDTTLSAFGVFATPFGFSYWYIGNRYNTALFKSNDIGISIGNPVNQSPSFNGIELYAGKGIKSADIKSKLVSTDANGVFKGIDLSALTPIADPSTATVEDVANLLNSLVAVLKA